MPENTANRIISGTMLKKSDIPALLASDTVSLCAAANKLRIHYRGNKISLCAIIDGIGGGCSEDCKFCAQGKACSKQTNIHAFTDEEEIINDCKYHEKAGVHRYSIVTAGRTLSAANFEKALSAYKRMHEECPEIQLCASHGLLNFEQLKQLKEAGVSRCHCNLETSERFFPKICTTRTYADKLKTIENAKKAGMEICSGGIIGMGETLDDRIDLAFKLRELDVSSIPINVLTPIKGTPLENAEQLTADEILRTVALFRLIVPKAEIRMAAGRKLLENNGIKAFLSGADATITGDMITTTGSNIAADKKMFAENYFEI